jgi:hypothetical protein
MPGPYSKEFRAETVALLRSSGKTPPQLGAELGITRQVDLHRPILASSSSPLGLRAHRFRFGRRRDRGGSAGMPDDTRFS